MLIKIFNMYHVDPTLVSVIGIDRDKQVIGIQLKEQQGILGIPSDVYEAYGMTAEEAIDNIASEVNAALKKAEF